MVLPVARFREFFRELDALGLAAGERCRGLADLDVAEADIEQSFEFLADRGNIFEQRQGILDCGIEQVGDREAFEFDGERFAVVAVAPANVARDVNVGQEIHLDAFQPAAFARLAATAFDVEREASGFVTTCPRFRQHRVKLAQRREQPGKRRRIRTRRAADRFLVDLDDLIDEIEAFDAVVGERLAADRRFVNVLVECRIKNLFDKRRFTAARNARDDRQQAKRKFGVDIFKIVAACSFDLNPAAIGQPADIGNFDF